MHYSFSIYNFSSKEIDQICYLLKKRWSGLDFLDQRKLSQQVKNYACMNQLTTYRADGKLIYSPQKYAFPLEFIPVECLKRIIFPMLKDSGVTSVERLLKDVRWSQLCIPCYQTDGPDKQSIELVNTILFMLHRAGYIKFYNGGDVWEVHMIKPN